MLVCMEEVLDRRSDGHGERAGLLGSEAGGEDWMTGGGVWQPRAPVAYDAGVGQDRRIGDHCPTSACGGSGNRSGLMRCGGMPVSAEMRPTRSAGTRPRDFHLETEL